MDVTVRQVNAFVDNGKGGNPAGVVLDADHLSATQKQAVARKVARSETAFVSRSQIADFKLEFYTPTRQIAHCGHATIAAFGFMRQAGLVTSGHTSKETIDGTRRILFREDSAFMEQLAPHYRSPGEDVAAMLESIGIAGEDLLQGQMPTIVNTGNAFLVVPLRSRQVLASLVPDAAAIGALSERHGLIGYYAFSLETARSNRDATARMFAPAYGIDEESATGMAAGPLAAYLRERVGIRATAFAIEQGCFMAPASPSLIKVMLEVERGGIKGLMAGGKARVMDEIVVSI